MVKLLTLQDMTSRFLQKMGKENATKKYETYEDIIDIVCPSKTLKQHWKEIGFRFTDIQLATVIVNETSLSDKIKCLQYLHQIASGEVAFKITCYLRCMEKWWEKFQDTSEDSCFVVYNAEKRNNNFDYDVVGITKKFSEALKVAQCYGNDYWVKIEKTRYVQETDKTDEYGEYDSGCLATIEFDENGYIGSCYGFYDDEYLSRLGGFEWPFGFDRFKIPHPFRRGDVVRCYPYRRSGGIDLAWAYVHSGPSGTETYDEYEDKSINSWGGDYSDIMITVEEMDEEGEFGHDHLSPLYIEKAEDDGGYPYRILEWTGNFCGEGYGYVQDIQMLLEEYRNLKDKSAKCGW